MEATKYFVNSLPTNYATLDKKIETQVFCDQIYKNSNRC